MDEEDEHSPFMKKPFCIYRGHSADLLDISWSKVTYIVEVLVFLLKASPTGISYLQSFGILITWHICIYGSNY